MTLLLGYARVSADDQEACAQTRALKAAGCERVFTEQVSVGRWDRPELHRLLGRIRGGDVLVVWRLDRLSRSLKDLLHLMEHVEAAGAGFRCLVEAIDTTTAAGRMMMQMCGAFAEFERAMVRERTKVGLLAAAARGHRRGRPPKLSQDQRAEIVDMVTTGRGTNAEAARIYKVNPGTISRVLAAARHSPASNQNQQS